MGVDNVGFKTTSIYCSPLSLLFAFFSPFLPESTQPQNLHFCAKSNFVLKTCCLSCLLCLACNICHHHLCTFFMCHQVFWRPYPRCKTKNSSLPFWLHRCRQPAVSGLLPVPLLRLHVSCHHFRRPAGGSDRGSNSKNTVFICSSALFGDTCLC